MTQATISIKTIFSSLDFFSTLDEKQIDLISSFSSINNYSKDYVVYYEKQSSPNLLFLVYGEAKAYKIDKHDNEIFLYHIQTNSLISELSKLDNEKITSNSNLCLIENSQILSINYKKFKKLFLDTNILYNQFISEIINRSNQLHTLINREFIYDSVTKVAMILKSDLELFNKLKRSEVSLMLHIQPETLSRVLNKLKRNKTIESTQGNIKILDELALEAILEE